MGAMKNYLLELQDLEDQIECDLEQAILKAQKLSEACWAAGDCAAEYAPDVDILTAYRKQFERLSTRLGEIESARESFKSAQLRP